MKTTSPNSGGHRSAFQFRLRGILVGIVVLSVGFAWIANRLSRDRRLRLTIDRILADQGMVEYRFQPRRNWIGAICGDVNRSVRLLEVPPTLSIRDVAAFDNLEVLNIWQATPEAFRVASHMTQLRSLRLCGDCGHSLAELGAMPNLKELQVEFDKMFNDCGSLGKFTQLERLSLRGTGVVDIGPLEKFSNLRTLDLASTQVTTLKPLVGLSNLVDVVLSYTSVRDDDLAALANLDKLHRVDLYSCPNVTDLSALRHLPRVFVVVSDPDSVRIPTELIGRVDDLLPEETARGPS